LSTYALWALLLLVQNAAFTWVSRARNSGSVQYAAVASIFSNGVWFLGQMFIVNVFVRAKEADSLALLLPTMMWYTVWTTVGSTLAMLVLRRWFETGNRRVGA
jgi:hypothetical protein